MAEKCCVCGRPLVGKFFYRLSFTGSFDDGISEEQIFGLKLTGAEEKICSNPLCVARAAIRGIKEFLRRQEARKKILRPKFGGS